MHRALAESIELFSQAVATSNRPEDRNLGTKYLANLAPLLASAVLGKDILKDLDGIERLFGCTWLLDQVPFEPALAKWREFRDEYEQVTLRSMTVNERLSALELHGAFDQARATKDVNEVRRILRRIRVDENAIAAITGADGSTG